MAAITAGTAFRLPKSLQGFAEAHVFSLRITAPVSAAGVISCHRYCGICPRHRLAAGVVRGVCCDAGNGCQPVGIRPNRQSHRITNISVRDTHIEVSEQLTG